jgi:site-specific DNA recombinase
LPIRVEYREYLTKKVNGIFELIFVFIGVQEGIKNEKTHQNVDGFFSVAGTGLEPVTFGL